MTLPELCDCSESQDNTLPDSSPQSQNNTTTTTTSTTPTNNIHHHPSTTTTPTTNNVHHHPPPPSTTTPVSPNTPTPPPSPTTTLTTPPTLHNNSTSSATTASSTITSTKVGKALLGVLMRAASQGRATCSLAGCVDVLSTRPDDVMLCVMPLLPQADAAATIQSTLIRAVCQEHGIRVLTVDCDVKLAKAVCTEVEKVEEEEKAKKEKGEKKKRFRGLGLRGLGVEVEEEEDEDEEEEDEVDECCGGCSPPWEKDENFNQVVPMKKPSPCSEDVMTSPPLLISDYDDLAPVMGFPCVLVEFPQDPSPEDELVAEFGKQQLYSGLTSETYIELPD